MPKKSILAWDKMYHPQEYRRIQTYLEGFIDYERKPFFSYQRSIKLTRMRALLSALAIDVGKLRVIHIAGTKGKGSTAHMAAAILAASGNRVGLYTSPHFFSFRERIRVVSRAFGTTLRWEAISPREVVKIVNEMRPAIAQFGNIFRLGKLTFFEVYTALAFKYFLAQALDWVVLETGLGGRLDATNVVAPVACILTHIGYDHTHVLGSTLAKIAAEKAGIIKRDVPVVTGHQRASALEVIRRRCRKMRSPLLRLGVDFFTQNVRKGRKRSLFDFRLGDVRIKNLAIPLLGAHQIENAACALAALAFAPGRDTLAPRAVRSGLRQAFVEGRFEKTSASPLLILDIAHNPSSFRALAESLKAYYPQKKIILIFAASKDKDIKAMLASLRLSVFIVTRFHNARCMCPQEVLAGFRHPRTVVTGDIGEALREAKKRYNKNSVIVVSGSFFLIAEAKAYLKKNHGRI
jgi:dihydrofolate synthase/folylpolyglutamate synthase